MPRTWGYWTEQKLQMLAEYLPRFTTASKSVGVTVYLDLFAGDIRNMSRTTGETISGSPKIALDAVPAFTKVHLFELRPYAARLEAQLRTEHPDRDINVWAGDCNETIEAALASLAPTRWAPTFAFVDQYAAEVQWATLEKLAAFKRGSRYKVELWMLFAHSMLPRGLASEDQDAVARFTDRIDRMFGTHRWHDAYQARLDDVLAPADLREELANLMRWRLEQDLGYKQTHAFEMRNTGNQPIYTMIFATDNAAGNRIMSSIYDTAASRQPAMRAAARDARTKQNEEKSGAHGLFEMSSTPRPGDVVKYEHTPPVPPYERSS